MNASSKAILPDVQTSFGFTGCVHTQHMVIVTDWKFSLPSGRRKLMPAKCGSSTYGLGELSPPNHEKRIYPPNSKGDT